jgi:hypothetical protein
MIDFQISEHNGSSEAIANTMERLQATKYSKPSLKSRLEEVTKQRGRLAFELAYKNKLTTLGTDLEDGAQHVIELLRSALADFKQSEEEIKREFEEIEKEIAAGGLSRD